MDVLAALSRWLHVISAIVAIGGAVFFWAVVPVGLAEADAASRDSVLRSLRRKFKVIVHAAVTLLILAGAFNSWRGWGDYKLERGVMHALWGMHVLFGLIVIGLSISLLAKPEQLLIIDVRRPDELTRVGGFPVFLSVQIKELENSVAWIPKDRTIVTVSNHASRSGRAADLLASKGFKVAGLVGAQTFEEQGGKLTKFEIPVRTGGANAAAAVAPAQAPATNQ